MKMGGIKMVKMGGRKWVDENGENGWMETAKMGEQHEYTNI